MKITVIVPVYNRKEYLSKCIDSVFQKTDAELELIMIDDGSTDGSSEMLDEYVKNNKNIRVIHKKNEGPGVARNVGIEQASGEFIYFLDSDDYMLEGAWDYFCSVQEKYSPDIIAVRSVSTWDGTAVPECNVGKCIEEVLNSEETMKAYLNDEILSGPPHKLFKRSVIGDVRFPALYRHEDAYIMHELLGASQKTVKSDHVCSVIVNHSDSLIHSKDYSEEFDALEVGNVIVKYVSDRFPSLIDLAMVEKLRRMDSLFRECCWEGVYRKYRGQLKTLKRDIKKEYGLIKHTDAAMFGKCRNDIFFPAIVWCVTRLRRLKYEMRKN